MPFSHGRNAKLYIDNADAAACTNISGDLNSVTVTWTRDNPDVTTFGQDSHQRIAGLRDFTMTGAYVWNGAEASGSAAAQTLDALLTGSMPTRMQYAPAGSITGCPLYTACVLVNSHSHTAGVNAAIVGNFSLQLASGSVTSGSCV
jgi:hypothetical protein